MTTKKIKKKKSVNQDLYLIKKIDKFYLISEQMIYHLSLDDAFYLWSLAFEEQSRQLLADALSSDHLVEGIKVVDGLEKTLTKLEEIFPGLKSRFYILNQKKYKNIS